MAPANSKKKDAFGRNRFEPDPNRKRKKLSGKKLKKFHENHNRLKVKK